MIFGLTLSWAKGVLGSPTDSQQEVSGSIQTHSIRGPHGKPGADRAIELCDWLGEPYDESLLNVPQVNTSENQVHAGGIDWTNSHQGKHRA